MTGGLYTVTFVSTAADVPSHLWDLAFTPPLEGRWWYETLEASRLEDQFTFLYGVIAQDGEPVGLAPAFVMNVPISLVVPPEVLPIVKIIGKVVPSTLFQRTLFIGSPCSDEGTVGFVPGVDIGQALSCLQNALDKKARELRSPMLVWKDFPHEMASHLEHIAKAHGLFRLVSYPGTEIALASKRKDDYYAAMKGTRRHQLKKKLRRSAEMTKIDVDVLQNPDAGTLDEIFGLFMQTYAKATTKFERLDRSFFDVIALKPVSHFVLLREAATGQMVAFMLCFVLDGRVINKFIGIDYSRPKDWTLYFRLWDATVDWALSQGFKSIQSGQTGYSAKILVGHRLVPLTNYCRHSNGLVNLIYRKVGATVDWHTLDEDLAAYLKAHPEDAQASHPPAS